MRFLVLLSLAGLLAACSSPGGGFGSSIVPQNTSAPATAPVRPAPTLLPPPDATALIGLDAFALRALFGSPDFQRNEPGAEIWRYAGEACALFVYFYEDDAATLRTSFVEARADAGGALPVDPCIASVSRAHQLSAQGY